MWKKKYTDDYILEVYDEIVKIDNDIKILQEKKREILEEKWIKITSFYYRLRQLWKTI